MSPLYLFLLLIISTVAQAQDHVSIFNKGVEAQNNQHYKEAIQYYQKCLDLQPDYIKARHGIGAAQYNWALQNYRNKAYAAAIDLFNKAEAYNIEDPNIAYMRGICFKEQGQYQEAIKQYDKAIGLSKKPASIYAARAWANSAMHLHEQRLIDMQKAAQSDAKNARYHYYCGKFKQEVSHEVYKTALQNFDLALEIDFSYKEAYRERGAYYMTFGQFKKALPDLLKAKALGDKEVDALIDAAQYELDALGE